MRLVVRYACGGGGKSMIIRDPQTEALAAEVAALANETRTQVVRTACKSARNGCRLVRIDMLARSVSTGS
jgi:hypothetical protein